MSEELEPEQLLELMKGEILNFRGVQWMLNGEAMPFTLQSLTQVANIAIKAASTIPASEARELPPLIEWKDGSHDYVMGYNEAIEACRAALASTRTASKQEIVTAGDCMARWLYGLSQSEAMPESWRTTCAELAQAWKGAVSGEVNAGAAAGGNTCKESPVDVEAERKLFEAWASSQNWIIHRNSFGEYQYSTARDGWDCWLAARTQADAGKDSPTTKPENT